MVYEFGPFRQDAAACTLTRRGMPVTITPKAYQTLLYLVSNAGRTVGREEMIRALWPDTFVEEGNLNYNISQIRKILGEYAPGVPYIQTLPKQGYRFIAEVSQVSNGDGQSSRSSEPGRLRGMWMAELLILLVASALATWLLPRYRDTAREKTPALVRLTSDTGLTMTPALSPDGKLIAYASDRGGEGNLDIWVQQVGGGEALRLTEDHADDYAPSFSPDGRSIAFRSEREGGGIYVVSALGGEARKIAPYGRRPKFSPDGKWIAYWIGTQIGDTSSFFMTPGAGKIYLVPSAGGPPRELQPEFSAAGYPIWTPDSRHLLFLGNRDPIETQESATDWWVTGIEGGPAVATRASAAFRSLGFPTVGQAPEAWTADGAGVLISATLGDTRNIWQVPIASGNWQVSGAPRRLTFSTIMDVQPSMAGNNVAFASLSGSVDVWSLPIDADRDTPADRLERLTQDAFVHGYPTVSPDGTKLAFSSRRSGSRDIFVKDLLRSSKETVVSIPPGPSFNPSFSPDGITLLYKVAEKQTSVAYAAPIAGGYRERICDDCSDYGWSSDGKKLLLVGTFPARISILDLASKRRTALLNCAASRLWNPRYSPDDRWVSFNATTPGGSRIFVAPVRDAGPIPESEWIAITGGAWDDKPRWSPDGNTLYFVSERDRFRCIWAQPLDAQKHPAGPAIPVFHAHEARRSLANVGIGDLGISIARDKLVFNMSERTGNLWMTNLGDRR